MAGIPRSPQAVHWFVARSAQGRLAPSAESVMLPVLRISTTDQHLSTSEEARHEDGYDHDQSRRD